MDKKKLIIGLEIATIIILAIFIWRIQILGNNFKANCQTTYSVNQTCPCTSEKTKAVMEFPTLGFNMTNLTKNF